jgi:hypothetical protein
MKKYIIYRITNTINNMIYIGVHQTFDLNDDYMGSGKYLINAINKYGIENFSKEIMQIFNSSKQMYEMESLSVDENFVKRKDTYNLKVGGFGGFDHVNQNSDMQREKVYLALKKMKELAKDHEWTKQRSDKISNSMKQQYKDGKRKPLDPYSFLGRTHTDESKEKIGQMNSFHQLGKKNSQYGTYWIYNNNLKQNKKIPKDEFDMWKSKGWLRGRKF